jgi:hypothetical protein
MDNRQEVVGPTFPGPFLLAAQRLLACGCNVIPLRPGDKTPAIGWKPMQSTRLIERDWDEVDRYLHSWWGNEDHGLGVVTGAVSEIVVVDVDSDDARELVERTCGWPRTVTTKTAKGAHLWFRHPGEATRNGVRRAESALDVRGDGGYVVVPPSVHPSGFEYRWTVSPFTFSGGMWPPIVLPDELHQLLWPARKLTPTGAAPTILTDGYVRAAFEREVAAVRSASSGARNDTLNRSVFAVWRFVTQGRLDEEVVVREFAYAARACGLDDLEAAATIKSAREGRRG